MCVMGESRCQWPDVDADSNPGTPETDGKVTVIIPSMMTAQFAQAVLKKLGAYAEKAAARAKAAAEAEEAAAEAAERRRGQCIRVLAKRGAVSLSFELTFVCGETIRQNDSSVKHC